MANEIRRRQNSVKGLLTSALSASDTTLTSTTSTGLSSIIGGIPSTDYMSIILDPDGSAGTPEIVWIISLTSGATSATILRGKEGSTARAHANSIPWVHGATVSDFVSSGGSSGSGYTFSPNADQVPSTPNPADYEFDRATTTIPTGWSWWNQGALTYEESGGIGSFAVPDEGPEAFRGIIRPIPVSATTLTAKVSSAIQGSITRLGLGLIESSTGKTFLVALDGNRAVTTTTYTTTASVPATGGAFVSSDNGVRVDPLYVRLTRISSSVFRVEHSADGKSWRIDNVSLDLGWTPDQVALLSRASGSSGFFGAHWFRVNWTPPTTGITVGGSGSGSGSAYTFSPNADQIPSTPSSGDNEFNGNSTSTLPTGWSWVNQGSAAYTENGGAGTVTVTDFNNTHLIARDLPSGATWDIFTKIQYTGTESGGGDFGLWLTDGTGAFGITAYAGYTRTVVYTSVLNNGGGAQGVAHIDRSPVRYFRIHKNSATSYDFYVSFDGVSWRTLELGRNVTSFLTPTKAAIGGWTNTFPNQSSVEWYRENWTLPTAGITVGGGGSSSSAPTTRGATVINVDPYSLRTTTTTNNVEAILFDMDVSIYALAGDTISLDVRALYSFNNNGNGKLSTLKVVRGGVGGTTLASFMGSATVDNSLGTDITYNTSLTDVAPSTGTQRYTVTLTTTSGNLNLASSTRILRVSGPHAIALSSPSPDDTPSLLNAANYEFDGSVTSGSVIPVDWSWFNQGTDVYEEHDGAGVIKQTAASSLWRAIVRTLPSGWNSVTSKFSGYVPDNSSDRYAMILVDTTGKVMMIGVSQGGGIQPYVFNADGSYSGYGPAASGPSAYTTSGIVRYWRVSRSGNIYTIFLSYTGHFFFPSSQFDITGSPLGTLDRVGFGLQIPNFYGNAFESYAVVPEWIRFS